MPDEEMSREEMIYRMADHAGQAARELVGQVMLKNAPIGHVTCESVSIICCPEEIVDALMKLAYALLNAKPGETHTSQIWTRPLPSDDGPSRLN